MTVECNEFQDQCREVLGQLLDGVPTRNGSLATITITFTAGQFTRWASREVLKVALDKSSDNHCGQCPLMVAVINRACDLIEQTETVADLPN